MTDNDFNVRIQGLSDLSGEGSEDGFWVFWGIKWGKLGLANYNRKVNT
jgi:hypothetical protein